MNKKLIFPVVALALLGFGIIGTSLSFAEETTTPNESIAQRIAERFSLNENEVQKVFDEVRNERLAEMQTKQEEKLTQLVTEGKITEDQKNLIFKKQKELRAERETERVNFTDLTLEKRKAQIEERKTDLETWAEENGIGAEYLMHFGGKEHIGPRLNPER